MSEKKPKIEALITEAEEMISSKPAEAEMKFRNLLQYALNPILWLRIQSGLAYSLWQQSKLREAEQIYQLLLNRAKDLDEDEFIGDSYIGLARIAINEASLDKSENYCEKALKIYQLKGILEKELTTLNIIGVIYYTKGNAKLAIQTFKKCLQLMPQRPIVLYVNVLNNLGLAYRLQGNIEKAAEFFSSAFEFASKNHFKWVLSIFENNLAETLCLLGDYQKALHHLQYGLEIAKENKDVKGVALLKTTYANYLIQTGQLDFAYQAIISALQLYENLDDPFGEIDSLLVFANYWFIRGHLQKARKKLEKAWDIIQKSGFKESAIEVLIFLAEIYENLGNTDLAYNYIKFANSIAQKRDSDLARAQVLTQRGLIMVNHNQYHEAELILNDAIWLAKKIQHSDLEYKAEMLLARNFLGQYMQDYRKQDFQRAIELIQDAKIVSKRQKLIPRYIEALIIEGMLLSSSDSHGDAKRVLIQARTLANERGMLIQAQTAHERLLLVTGSGQSEDIKKPFKKIVLSLILDEISRATTTYLESNFSEVDLDETFMAVFTMDPKIGTKILETENINLDDDFWYRQIFQIASLYSISLGQDHLSHNRLFGPLPFGETDLRSIIFTRTFSETIKNRENQETILFCMVFPKEMMPLFYDRKRVEVFFANQTEQLSSSNQITKSFLKTMHENIIAEIIADLYDPMM
ncbi:MAG: tetratricopeptide repeat protein [Candidatus Lokiarchaeota archaeon]|nr:tetratricopeptide repeat protein [Candidatus Harpocratesius repetitus]